MQVRGGNFSKWWLLLAIPLLEVAGHFKPYRLYWVLVYPDSGTGIWFKKRG
jgi:hypothetical protein